MFLKELPSTVRPIKGNYEICLIYLFLHVCALTGNALFVDGVGIKQLFIYDIIVMLHKAKMIVNNINVILYFREGSERA